MEEKKRRRKVREREREKQIEEIEAMEGRNVVMKKQALNPIT